MLMLVSCQSNSNDAYNNSEELTQNETTQEEVEANQGTELEESTENETAEEETVTNQTTDPVGNSEDYGDVFQYLDPSMIKSEYAMSIIEILASDTYLGRQSGTKENEHAVDELVRLFKENGLEPIESLDGYKQPFEQFVVLPEEPTFAQLEGEEPYVYQHDFTERFIMGSTDIDGEITAEMIYIEDMKALSEDSERFNHKILLMPRELSYDRAVWSEMNKMQKQDIFIEAVIVSGDGVDAGMRVARYIRNIENNNFEEDDPIYLEFRESRFQELIAASKENKKLTLKQNYMTALKTPSNVVGMIPGKNEDGENEVVILGAHLDHVGNNMDGTFNPGALDNASGVSVLLEIARILKDEEQPENTIVFVAFNGEEDGLLGSEYFCDNPPVEYKITETVMLNFDMVGASNDVPLLVASSSYSGEKLGEEYKDIVESLSIDYTLGQSYGSDHVNFGDKGIPALMFIHFDPTYYHTSGDTLENAVDENRLEEVIRLALALVDREAYQDLD